MKKNVKILSLILVIACMTAIFVLSSQVAMDSNDLSKTVTFYLHKIVNKALPSVDISFIHFNNIIRKYAHFASYFALGTLVLNTFRRFGKRSMGAIATSFVICVLYAITDELHQSIVPGRGPSRFDIMIDSLGSFTGITFYLIISNIKNKISGRHFWKK